LKKIKITPIARTKHDALILQYENPDVPECEMVIGKSFYSINAQMPNGFCSSAWQNVYPFVFALASGAKDFYDGWLKNKESAIIACNDGLRPVSFLIEVVNEK